MPTLYKCVKLGTAVNACTLRILQSMKQKNANWRPAWCTQGNPQHTLKKVQIANMQCLYNYLANSKVLLSFILIIISHIFVYLLQWRFKIVKGACNANQKIISILYVVLKEERNLTWMGDDGNGVRALTWDYHMDKWQVMEPTAVGPLDGAPLSLTFLSFG